MARGRPARRRRDLTNLYLTPACGERRVGSLDAMTYNVEKTDEEWRAELSPEEYAVLRKAGTERAFVGKLTDTETKGVYTLQGLPGHATSSPTPSSTPSTSGRRSTSR